MREKCLDFLARVVVPGNRTGLAIWISIALAGLATLLIIPLMSNVLTRSTVPVVVSYTLEFVICLSSGMIVFGTTELVSARFPAAIQNGVIRFVEILVSAAVAVLVYIIGPEEKMCDAAEWVFVRELEDCRSAVDDVGGNQDAQGRCKALMDRFPNRPEPLELLGRYSYRNASATVW